MTRTNRVAIVTGASRGLGRVIARVLARRGYALVLGARNTAALDEVAAWLDRGDSPPRVVTVSGDVADPAARERLVAEARALGPLRVLVNNASELGAIEPLTDAPLVRIERVLAVNLLAPLALTQLAMASFEVPRSAEAGLYESGLVVNITSDAAQGAYEGWGVYGASKAALDLASRTFANELHERGVSVVSVDPGDMRTRMHQAAFPGQDISDRPLPEVTEPFWTWLFDQPPAAVNGQRFAAQQEDTRWLSPA